MCNAVSDWGIGEVTRPAPEGFPEARSDVPNCNYEAKADGKVALGAGACTVCWRDLAAYFVRKM